MVNTYTRTDRVLLHVDHVTMQYGNKIILRDVSATVTDVVKPGSTVGQVICFLGPSGMGKSQLCRILSGLQKPSLGTVTLADAVETRKGKVGMVPQYYPLFQYATVKNNLLIAGKQAGLSVVRAIEKAAGLVHQLGLEEHFDKYPRELSGGTQQRVAIAQQLMCADHYLVMDEPFSGLDPIMKRKAGELIVKLSDLHEDNVIIVVTHDIKQGLKVSDMVWLLGLEPDGDSFKPGARIVETYDLASMGLCWEPDIESKPDFRELVAHIENRFQTLR